MNPGLIANGHGLGASGQKIPATGGAPTVSLEATTDTKTASLGVNFDLSTASLNQSLSITAQTPLGQGADYQNISTLDGLTKASSIGFTYNLLHVGVWRSRTMNQASPTYQSDCKSVIDDYVQANPAANVPAYLDSFCSGNLLSQLIAKDASLSDATKAALAGQLQQLHQQIQVSTPDLVLFSMNGKVGYDQHAFYNANTLAKGSANTTPFQIGAAATYVFNGGSMSATLSYAFQRAYTDGAGGSTQTLCPPTGSPVLKCTTGYISAPTQTDKQLLTMDFRYISPRSWPIPIAVNPTATYDAQAGTYGFQLPIYFLNDKTKALTGGVRYDWTSNKHESVVGIFLSSAFCILPGNSACSSSSK